MTNGLNCAVMSMIIMAAALFHNSGLTGVDDIDGAFAALRTLLSNNAAIIFGIGLLASGFASSSVGTMSGQVVMQGFIQRRIPIFLRRAVTLVPALVVIGIGANPSAALVFSQVVLSFGIPFALVPLLLATRDRRVMAEMTNRRLTNVTMLLITVTITGLTIADGRVVDDLGGGIANEDGATLHLVNDTVTNNSAYGIGGGLWNDGGATVSERSPIGMAGIA